MAITAPHEVTDTAKVEAIAADMRANGWVGNPILVDDEDSNEPKALTGTHRLAAAELAGVEPVAYSLEGTGVDVEALFFDCVDDEDMLGVIEQSGDEEAIRIMREEVENNHMTRTAPRTQPLSGTAKRLRDTYSHEQLAHLLYQSDLRVAHLQRVMDDLAEEVRQLKDECAEWR